MPSISVFFLYCFAVSDVAACRRETGREGSGQGDDGSFEST